MYTQDNQIVFEDYEIEIINTLNNTINETVRLGFDLTSRSSKKVDYLHEQMIDMLERYIDTSKYAIVQEGRVQGLIFPKDCDIVIVDRYKFQTNDGSTLEEVINNSKGGKTVIISGVEEVISVKNPLSSYKKNSVNYTEAVIGEAMNIKQMGIRYTHFMFISDKLPLYKNETIRGNKKRLLTGFEDIGAKQIENFKKIKSLDIINDFVTFLYNIDRYNYEYTYSEDLIGSEPGVTLYYEKIQEIGYTFYFFQYLSDFYNRYGEK